MSRDDPFVAALPVEECAANGSTLLAVTAAGNAHLETVAPWTAFKKGDDAAKAEAAAALTAVLEVARIAAVALSPVVPSLSARILAQLDQFLPDQEADASHVTSTGGGAAATPATARRRNRPPATAVAAR